jgi:hypothetical protein
VTMRLVDTGKFSRPVLGKVRQNGKRVWEIIFLLFVGALITFIATPLCTTEPTTGRRSLSISKTSENARIVRSRSHLVMRCHKMIHSSQKSEHYIPLIKKNPGAAFAHDLIKNRRHCYPTTRLLVC